MSAASEALLFARNFLKKPFLLASLIPSSRYAVRRILDRVDWEQARVVVEYGPGVGTVTREILRRMRPDAVLVAIEMNREFIDYLHREFSDPRLHAVCDSAADVRLVLAALGLEKADCIISGIPFTTIPDALRRRIMAESRRALRDDGQMIVYQFLRTVRPYLRRIFARVDEDIEVLNILPMRLFYCQP